MARRAATPAKITPLLIPPDAAGVVVFGGTFDPPHRWHERVARAVRRALFPHGWIVAVPAARSPLKERGPVAPDDDRIAMAQLALRALPRTIVWTDEIDRSGAGPSYTVETLARMRRVLGNGVPLRLLIGADQAGQFHRWREHRRVLELAAPAVVLRPPLATAAALRRALEGAGAWTQREIEQWLGRLVPVRARDVSSSEIRRALGEGRAGAVRSAIAPAVLDYIRQRGLYGVREGRPLSAADDTSPRAPAASRRPAPARSRR